MKYVLRLSLNLMLTLLALSSSAQTNQKISEIPFELFGGHTFIELKIGKSDVLSFIFDTGAGATVINSSTSERLNLSAAIGANYSALSKLEVAMSRCSIWR
ncbi:MAG: hypothetical protein AAGC47_12625 [Bacteroidota bacterium]